jgi:hypothetical protein
MNEALIQALPAIIECVAREQRQRATGNVIIESADLYAAMDAVGFHDRFTNNELGAAMVKVGAKRVAAGSDGARYVFEGCRSLSDVVRLTTIRAAEPDHLEY